MATLTVRASDDVAFFMRGVEIDSFILISNDAINFEDVAYGGSNKVYPLIER